MDVGSLKKVYIVLAISILLIGGCTSRTITLTESNAIERVHKDHSDFPIKAGETKTIKQPIGPFGSIRNVDYKTTADKTVDGKFIITFSKDWHQTVNGQIVFSYWKYSVGPEGVTLLESQNKDDLIHLIK